MFSSKGVTEKRIFNTITGFAGRHLVQNGQSLCSSSYANAGITGIGGGSNAYNTSGGSFGGYFFVRHIEQTDHGNAYWFLEGFDITNFIHVRTLMTTLLTAASGRFAVGMFPATVGGGVYATIVSGINAGSTLAAAYAGQGALEIEFASGVVTQQSGYLDISALKGKYMFYLEAIATDATSTSKLGEAQLFHIYLDV